jgi:hypothetical protein
MASALRCQAARTRTDFDLDRKSNDWNPYGLREYVSGSRRKA